MTLQKREKRLLVFLFLVLAVWGLRWVLQNISGGELGIGLGRGSSARVAEARGFQIDVAELRLDDLEPSSKTLVLGRDPFRFAAKPPPAPPPPSRPKRQRPPPPPPPPSGPVPPRFNMDYLGNFGTEARRIAVFSDGQTIHNAMAGEVLDGKFIVEQIGFESVDIGFLGFPEVPAKRLAVGG